MSARTDLRDLIATDAPDSWKLYPYPVNLRPFEDAAKSVAVVIEQRGLTAGTTSPDENGVPVGVELAIYVVVDGTRGADAEATEDRLETATEQMILLLEQLPEHVWDGTAVRDKYDDQKPCYTFTIRAGGALTTEE